MDVDIPSGSSVQVLRMAASEQQPILKEASFRVAVDSRYVDPAEVLPDSCEIAFLPPVSGG